MVSPILIDPQAVYDDGSLILILGLSERSLCKARRDGRLRFARKGKRTLYLGQWILDWIALDSEAVQPLREASNA